MTSEEIKLYIEQKGTSVDLLGKHMGLGNGTLLYRVSRIEKNPAWEKQILDALEGDFPLRKVVPVVPEHKLADLPDVQNGIFKVSKDGRVYRKVDGGYVLAKQFATGQGGKYSAVTSYVDGKQMNFLVHRLVAEAYLPNPEGKKNVIHLDGNGRNNHVDNLQWGTDSERAIRACENGSGRLLTVAGVPCICCGSATMRKDRLCRACELKQKVAQKRAETAERRMDAVENLLDSIDLETVNQRDIDMLIMHGRGATLQEISDRYGITRERVRQIIFKHFARAGKNKDVESQRQLAAYIKGMGFKQSHLAIRLGVAYSLINGMLTLRTAMPNDIYADLCRLVKFEHCQVANDAEEGGKPNGQVYSGATLPARYGPVAQAGYPAHEQR